MKVPLKNIREFWALMIAARFWSKVEVGHPANCWPWKAVRKNGYGAFRHRGRIAKASRIAWRLTYGAIPRGRCVCHRCDNPPCVNPLHLFLGTQTVNMRDKSTKGRWRGGRKRSAKESSPTRA